MAASLLRHPVFAIPRSESGSTFKTGRNNNRCEVLLRAGRGQMGVEAMEARLGSASLGETKDLAAELCKHFYNQGWVSGTGGSITLKVLEPHVDLHERLIVMAPSGVQKERMLPTDMYVLSADGSVLVAPTAKGSPHKPPKCSECCPLFLKAYQMRNAGAVIHSHGLESCLATMMNPSATEFRVEFSGFRTWR